MVDVNYRTIMRTFEKLYPTCTPTINSMLADVLAQGMVTGKWQSGSIIFCLKNWCGWADKRETTNNTKNEKVVTKEEADKLIQKYMQRCSMKVIS